VPRSDERVSHPPERLVATPQARAGQRIALLVEPLVPVVGDALTRIGTCFTLVGGTVSLVCATLSLV